MGDSESDRFNSLIEETLSAEPMADVPSSFHKAIVQRIHVVARRRQAERWYLWSSVGFIALVLALAGASIGALPRLLHGDLTNGLPGGLGLMDAAVAYLALSWRTAALLVGAAGCAAVILGASALLSTRRRRQRYRPVSSQSLLSL